MQRRLVQNFKFILEWDQGTCSLTNQTLCWTFHALQYFFPYMLPSPLCGIFFSTQVFTENIKIFVAVALK